jgi:GT2 family glycosyltransferase
MVAEMKASVIISSYSIERLQDVINATHSVLRQTYQDKEIILVVDRDKPNLVLCLREALPNIVKVVVSNRSQGLSAARNAGVQASYGDVVVFLDDDAVADANWLKVLMNNYQDPQVMAAGGRAVPVWEGNRPQWLPEELYWVVGCTYRGYTKGSKTPVRNIHGNSMSFRREIFTTIGGFDDNVGHRGGKPLGGEETEFCMRATSRYPYSHIVYDPEATISHKVPAKRCTLRYLFKRAYGEGVGKAIIHHLNEKRGPIEVEMSYLRCMLLKFVPMGLRRLFSRDFPGTASQLFAVGLAIFATGLGYIATRVQIAVHKRQDEQSEETT